MVFALLAVLGTSACQNGASPQSGGTDQDKELSSIESSLNGIEADLEQP